MPLISFKTLYIIINLISTHLKLFFHHFDAVQAENSSKSSHNSKHNLHFIFAIFFMALATFDGIVGLQYGHLQRVDLGVASLSTDPHIFLHQLTHRSIWLHSDMLMIVNISTVLGTLLALTFNSNYPEHLRFEVVATNRLKIGLQG